MWGSDLSGFDSWSLHSVASAQHGETGHHRVHVVRPGGPLHGLQKAERKAERGRQAGCRIRQSFQTCPCDLLPPGRNPLCKLRLSMGPSMDVVNVLMV